MRILVTGANGTVGRALIPVLEAAGHSVRRALRHAAGPDTIAIGDLGPETDWRAALTEIDAVIHTAAMTMGEGRQQAPDADRLYAVNRGAAYTLAAACRGKISRFIHISTIKVLGETAPTLLSEAAPLRPADLYAVTKAQAEEAIARALIGSATALTILRPPLVYAPGGKGNFHRLARLAASGLPLPLGAVHNRRSLIFVENLAHFAFKALDAEPGIYHLADGPPISTKDWIRLAAKVQGGQAVLVPIPTALMRKALEFLGKKGIAQRLLDDLALDTARADAALGFAPVPMEEGFRRALVKV
jgi:nucleoside-diphosphate-sugar epimerase